MNEDVPSLMPRRWQRVGLKETFLSLEE